LSQYLPFINNITFLYQYLFDGPGYLESEVFLVGQGQVAGGSDIQYDIAALNGDNLLFDCGLRSRFGTTTCHERASQRQHQDQKR